MMLMWGTTLGKAAHIRIVSNDTGAKDQYIKGIHLGNRTAASIVLIWKSKVFKLTIVLLRVVIIRVLLSPFLVTNLKTKKARDTRALNG